MNTSTRYIAALFAVGCLALGISATARQRDSLVTNREVEVRTIIDTVLAVTPREQQVPDYNSVDSTGRRGHHVQFQVGGGLGSIYGFLRGGLTGVEDPSHEQAGVSALIQLQYAYYFHPHWGIGLGLWMTNYTSHGYLEGNYSFSGPGVVDTDGENYEHHALLTKTWVERQILHVAAIPISLQAQTFGRSNRAGVFFDLGVAPGYAIMRDYHVLQGEIEHYGVYTHRGNADLHNSHEFTTVDYANGGSADVKEKGTIAVKPLITTFADLGLLVRMSKQTDFLLGVYGQYTVNNIQNANLQPLGWKDARFPNIDMPGYNGILASSNLQKGGALHPWEAGIKLGVHWHSLDKPRMQTVTVNDTTLQLVERNDSIWTERIDTLHLTPTQRIQRQIDKLNRIYFAFDSYLLNDESKLFLDQIAEQLKTIPNQVVIGGHASREGLRIHNMRLAHNRALVVKYYLVDKGVPSKRLIVRDYGSTVPNAINTTGDLSLDRRVEIIVLDE